MDTKEKITIKDLIEILKTLFKDTYHADARKYRDEVHIKFPNGQKFMIDVCDTSPDAEQAKFEEMIERIFAELSDEGYNKKFENGMLNWIQMGIWMREKIEAEKKGNQVSVTLKTAQKYIITVQRK